MQAVFWLWTKAKASTGVALSEIRGEFVNYVGTTVQKTQNLNVDIYTAVENIMLTFHHVSKIAAQHWMVSPQSGEFKQKIQPLFKALPVNQQLLFTPSFERVLRNIRQIILRHPSQPIST